MIVLPVVGRELCAESRRSFNYWLRVAGAGVLTLVAALTFLSMLRLPRFNAFNGALINPLDPSQLGTRLFGNLNAALFIALWVLVPLLTAECINREKREGTLGLLFLTPLTSTGIVIGKSVVHSLRAMTLYIAMLPVVVMPMVLGGLTWQDATMAALVNLGVLMLALAAGLLASAWTRDWLKSVAVAQLLAAFFVVVLLAVHRGNLVRVLTAAKPAPIVAGATGPITSGAFALSSVFEVDDWGGHGFLSNFRHLLAFATNLPWDEPRYFYTATGVAVQRPLTAWSEIWGGSPPSVHADWFLSTGAMVCGCLLVLLASVVVAGKSIEQGWREAPPSARRQQVNAVLTKPVVGQLWLRRRLRRALERNPVGWLQQYSWQARLTKWGWCAFVVFAESLLASGWRDAWNGQEWIARLLLIGMAFSATGSFRAERETGALELLLVTPLRAGQIIWGRLVGLFMQYLPAVLTLLLAVVCLMPARWSETLPWQSRSDSHWSERWVETLVAFVTVPVIGLSLSLLRINHLVSWIFACVVGIFVPTLISELFGHDGSAAMLWQLFTATLAIGWLHWNLTRRRFVVN